MQVYAQQAKDTELVVKATEVRERAERRLGEIMADMPKAEGAKGQLSGRDSSGGFVKNPPDKPAEPPPTLGSLGIG